MEFHENGGMRNFNDAATAQNAMRKGKKALNPWCCFKPDYLGALASFKEAAEIFSRLGDVDNAIECYKNLAICNKKIDDLFAASEAHKEAGYLYLENKGDTNKAKEEFNECIRLLNIGGKMERVQDTLIELARKCKQLNHDQLSEAYYQEIINSVFDEDNYLNGLATIKEYSNDLIAKSRYTRALELYNKHIEYVAKLGKYESTIAKCSLSIVCIHIILDEPYVAEEKLRDLEQTHPGLINSPFYEIGVNMIEAINEVNQVRYDKIVMTPIMSQLEINLLKALKKVKVEGGKKSTAPVKVEDIKLSEVKQKDNVKESPPIFEPNTSQRKSNNIENEVEEGEDYANEDNEKEERAKNEKTDSEYKESIEQKDQTIENKEEEIMGENDFGGIFV